MQERHVTVDRTRTSCRSPFLVLATQNPIEFEGTYPLPEAQVDRFMVRVSLGYPSPRPRWRCSPTTRRGTPSTRSSRSPPRRRSLAAQDAARRVHASDAAALLHRRAAHAHPRGPRGSSSARRPRAGLLLLRAAKARALLHGRAHALPDDVQALAGPILAHRILLGPEAVGETADGVIADAVSATPAL